MSGYIVTYLIFAGLFAAALLIIARSGSGPELHPPLINIKRIKAFFQRQPDNDQGAIEGAFPADRFESDTNG